MMNDCRAAILALVLMGLAGATSAQDIDGLFQPSGADWTCSPDQIRMDGGALAIQNGVFEGVENRCDLTNSQTDSRGATFTATCSTEGST